MTARVWIATGPADDAPERLLGLVRWVTGSAPERLQHACPRCGSSEHGRPVVVGPSGPVHVSLARDRDNRRCVVAVCLEAAVGIDLEAAGAADFDGFDGVALHPEEMGAGDRTRLWVRTEAVLKSHGVGLDVDPTSVRVDRSPLTLASRVTQVVDLPPHVLGDDWVCSVAVVDESEPRVQVWDDDGASRR